MPRAPKPLLVINKGTLYRLNACGGAREEWARIFGNTDQPVTPELIATCITHSIRIPWFLENTCGAKTINAICDDIEAAAFEDTAAVIPDAESHHLFNRAREMRSDEPIARWVHGVDEARWKIAAYYAVISLEIADRKDNAKLNAEVRFTYLHYSMQSVSRIHSTKKGAKPIDGIGRYCEALSASVLRRSRVINRALSLANTRRGQ